MKKLIFIFLLSSIFSYSQNKIDQFDITKEGIKPIVVEIDSLKTSSFIYEKAKEWIQLNYTNPDLVLKSDIKNSSLRINGYKKDAWTSVVSKLTYSFDIDYNIIIEIKDGKYRLQYIINKFILSGQDCGFNEKTFYTSDGKIIDGYIDAEKQIEKHMNYLSKSLYDYILGKKDNNW